MSDKTKQGSENLLRQHKTMTSTAASVSLRNIVQGYLYQRHHGLYLACKKVLDDIQFWEAPAARGRHQAYPGGLAIHTAQVMETALAMLETVENPRLAEVITAIVWHDYAKVYCYKQLDDKTYEYTKHNSLIGHLPLSVIYLIRTLAIYDIPIDTETQNFIIHLMLAHHGRLEWGSPVIPQCAEAFAIHCADMMSSQFISD